MLDLYAGTGALGLEALSRGAAFATFVENARPALVALRANVDALRVAKRARIVDASVDRADAQRLSSEPFDLVLVDPPYADVAGPAAKAVERLVAAGLLANDGVLVLEHASRDKAPAIAGLESSALRAYGDTSLTFYARAV